MMHIIYIRFNPNAFDATLIINYIFLAACKPILNLLPFFSCYRHRVLHKQLDLWLLTVVFSMLINCFT